MVQGNYILRFTDQNAVLDCVGGKGASLARMTGAGLPVPGGFFITTAAYQAFVAQNGLQPMIRKELADVDPNQLATVEAASGVIQANFNQGNLPAEVERAILEAYRALSPESVPVAVRSSATAEDLPEASFAGQQETYLNVLGEKELREAVKHCWASLWTARAIVYRGKNQVDQDSVALSVVVQKMASADAAGILFTANPINGRRDELLINAAWGLGEAVVSGAVTPDTIVVDKKTRKILRRETAEKRVMTTRGESGTREVAVPEAKVKQPAINNSQAVALAKLGEKIEALYATPMDVEWALAGGEYSILQARPITTLPPEWKRPNPKALYARGSLAEHLPNPVTPLFGTLGLRSVNQATEELAWMLNFDPREAEYQYTPINGYVYMGFLATPSIVMNMVKVSLTVFRKMIREARMLWHESREKLDAVIAKWKTVVDDEEALRALPALELLGGTGEVFTQVGRFYTVLQSGTLPAATSSEATFSQVYKLVRRKGDPEATTFLFGGDTVPIKSEQALFDLANWAKSCPSLADALLHRPTAELAAGLAGEAPEGVLPGDWAEWVSRFQDYQQTYGATVYELDFSNPTPVETPGLALDVVKMYLSGQGQDPYERQRAAAARREEAIQRVLPRLRWPVRGWFLRSMKWAQERGPDREDSLVDLGKANPLVRRLLGELGRRLVEAGTFDDAQDLYWLEEAEVASLCDLLDRGEPLSNLRETVAARKATWQAQLKLYPPAVLPEKSRWNSFVPWHKTDQGGNTLKGTGASAGKVTAPACVLLGPEDFGKMKPGAILVAVTTTPAWTPLFSMASGVVTDIGGPLSHGSIVAREYGIPAVMAVGMGTRRIKDGQVVTVDGSTGVVTLHDPADQAS